MSEDTEIQEIPEGWTIKSTDSYIIRNYRDICDAEGETVIEKCGIFAKKEQVEGILRRIPTKPFLLGRDPHNRELKR